MPGWGSARDCLQIPVEGMVAFAAQEAYLLFVKTLARTDVITGRYPVSHPITLDLTLKTS